MLDDEIKPAKVIDQKPVTVDDMMDSLLMLADPKAKDPTL